MTSAYDSAYDSAYGMFIKKNTEILRMTFAYGWLAYGKPQRKPGPRMTFAYGFAYDPRMASLSEKMVLRMALCMTSVYALHFRQLAVAMDQQYLRNAHPTQPR